MREILSQIEEMKARWMTGGSALTAAPADWRSAAGAEDPDLALLCFATQFQSLATRPDLVQRPKAKVPLPRLALPPLEGTARGLFRRVAAQKGVDLAPVLALMAARGRSAHPFDWFPSRTAEVPAVYGPWIDWRRDEVAQGTEEALSAETWDLYSPYGRRAELEEMRRRAPSEARDLLQEVFPSLSADQRQRLLPILEAGLGAEDIPFLEHLQDEDRSAKVRTIAGNYLARLGRAEADPEALTELAAFFSVERKGLIQRKLAVTAAKTKTKAQERRREELAASLPFAALAQALGLTTEALIEGWDFEGSPASGALMEMVTATGTAEEVVAFVTRAIEAQATFMLQTSAALERLPPEAQPAIAAQLAEGGEVDLMLAAQCLTEAPGTLPLPPLQGSEAFAVALRAIRKGSDTHQSLERTLFSLGLLAERSAAQALLDQVVAAGLLAPDPRLALLRLNAALEGPNL